MSGGGSGREPAQERSRAGARAAAWGVHALTASGAAVGLVALLAAARGDGRATGLWMLLALAIDGVDGTLARRARVGELAARLDGRRLDDIVDYLNYVVVPVFFLVHNGLVPHWSVGLAPVLASAYGFAQADAKTPDHYFLGFPSYWNVVALYAFALPAAPGVTAAWLLGLSAAVFLPIRYLHPSHMTRFRRITNGGAALWVLVLAAALVWPEPAARVHAVALSLAYPAWYVALSLWLGGLARR